VAHPALLDGATASWWVTLHVILLPVFPLLAAAQWTLLTSAPPLIRWSGRLAAFGFATFYGGLDAVSGIGAGTVVHAQHGFTPVAGEVFLIGDRLGYLGSGCFLAASVLLVVAATPNAGWWVLPGAVPLLAASVSFLDSHLFWPRGVFTMIGIAVGMYLLAVVSAPDGDQTSSRTHPPERATSEA
jgi:hypothetical protein